MLTNAQLKKIQQHYGSYEKGGRSVYPEILEEIYLACTQQQQDAIITEIVNNIFRVLSSDADHEARYQCLIIIKSLHKIFNLLNIELVNNIISKLDPLDNYLTEPQNSLTERLPKMQLVREFLRLFMPILTEDNVNMFAQHDIKTLSKISNFAKIPYEKKISASIFLNTHQIYWPQQILASVITAKAKCRTIDQNNINLLESITEQTEESRSDDALIRYLNLAEQKILLTHFLQTLESRNHTSFESFQKQQNLKAYCKQINPEVYDSVPIHEYFNKYTHEKIYAAAIFILENFPAKFVFKSSIDEKLTYAQELTRVAKAYSQFFEIGIMTETSLNKSSIDYFRSTYVKLLLTLRAKSMVYGCEQALSVKDILSSQRCSAIAIDTIKHLEYYLYISQEQIDESLPLIIKLFVESHNIANTNKVPKQWLELWSNKFKPIALIIEFEKALTGIADTERSTEIGPYTEITEALLRYLPIEYINVKTAQLYSYIVNNPNGESKKYYVRLLLTLWHIMPSSQQQVYLDAIKPILTVELNYDAEKYPPKTIIASMQILEIIYSKLPTQDSEPYAVKLGNYYALCERIIKERKQVVLASNTPLAAWFNLAESMRSTFKNLFENLTPDMQNKFVENNINSMVNGFDTDANFTGYSVLNIYFKDNPFRLQHYADKLLPKFLKIIANDHRHTGGLRDCDWHIEDGIYGIATKLLYQLYPHLSLQQQHEVAKVYVTRSIDKNVTYTAEDMFYELLPTVVTTEQKDAIKKQLQNSIINESIPNESRLDYFQHLGVDKETIYHARKIVQETEFYTSRKQTYLLNLTNSLLEIAANATNATPLQSKKMRA